MQQPTAVIQPTDRQRLAQGGPAPAICGNDAARAMITAPTRLSRRECASGAGRLTIPTSIAERVVQAIERASRPHAERHGRPLLRFGDDSYENGVPDRDVSALTLPASTGT